MTFCFFVSDLHGSTNRYRKLLGSIRSERPDVVFVGGDIFPSGSDAGPDPGWEGAGFLDGFLSPELARLRTALGPAYPAVVIILGNDDPRSHEPDMLAGAEKGLWVYLPGCKATVRGFEVFGYPFVPPTPFHLKDWERYDVSRHLPPGSVSPEEGWRTVRVERDRVRYGTIREDLETLAGGDDLSRAVFLFHTPPHDTRLDRADLEGRSVDHVPLDLHVGSVAVRRFIETRQPLLTLHGHIHESTALTGSWRDAIGRTHMFSAAHGGPELALVRFHLEDLPAASRDLL